MKTLIVGLLAAIGLIHTTDHRSLKELGIAEVPPMIYYSEYQPLVIAYTGLRRADEKKVRTTARKKKK